jgi:hypothetical protein
MRAQLYLDNASPLDVLIRALMFGYRLPFEHERPLDPSNHKIAELTRLPVVRAHVPSQSSVNQGEGSNLAYGATAADRVILNA